MTVWLERELDRSAAGKSNPGAMGLHRMNRTEYARAVRDLLDLEINARHALVHSLNTLRTSNPERAALICQQLHDNALLAAGIVEEPRLLVGRLNKLLEMAAK